MNTQHIEDRYDPFYTSREEYVRRARESCLKNYYGDQMPSREEILMEIAQKRAREEEQKKIKEQVVSEGNPSSVIPFDENRWNQAKNRTLEREEQSTTTMKVEKLDANTINLRLHASQGMVTSNERKEEYLPSIMTQLPIVEPKEENIPNTDDIIRMSGIEETTENRIENHYIDDFKEAYHSVENSNFVTSIQNAKPEELPLRKKFHNPTEMKAFRLFAIRCVCAFTILLALILLDKFSIEYKNVTPRSVYHHMISNELSSEIEEWIMMAIKK